ncbi:MAG: HAD family hydrolase [Micropepsaceae bacterium]
MPKRAPSPKGILFDLDDTILSAYGKPDVAWLKVAREFAIEIAPTAPTDFAVRVAQAAKTFWDDAGRHKEWRMQLDEARRKIVAQVMTDLPTPLPRGLASAIADRFTRLRDEEMHLFPGAHETLDEFKRRGVKLALITNGAAAVQRAKVARFALEHRFDHIQIEGEHGFGKPEEQAYRHALAALDMLAGDVWMVGDNLEWEVAAPQRLGIYAIWHDAHRQGLPPGSEVRPDRIITELRELLDA